MSEFAASDRPIDEPTRAGRTMDANLRPIPASRRQPLSDVPVDAWQNLADIAIEPNGYFLPSWLGPVNASARGRHNADAVTAWDHTPGEPSTRLIGLQPVISLRRAYHIPLPALVSADPYGSFATPLLKSGSVAKAAAQLLQAARDSGARALILRQIAIDGPVMRSLQEAAAARGTTIEILQSHHRACLDASADGEASLREALGAKKLKELRRQRSRLADQGEVSFTVANNETDIAAATEIFLNLEASGWKGKRGTALKQHAGDAAFIRAATQQLASERRCDIGVLSVGGKPIAAGIIIRHQDHAFYFKMGVDETYAKMSPGVQLTLDLTRHLCADPTITFADSSAIPGHPMIDPIWRQRRAIGDVFIPLQANDPIAALILKAVRMRENAYARLKRVVNKLRQR